MVLENSCPYVDEGSCLARALALKIRMVLLDRLFCDNLFVKIPLDIQIAWKFISEDVFEWNIIICTLCYEFLSAIFLPFLKTTDWKALLLWSYRKLSNGIPVLPFILSLSLCSIIFLQKNARISKNVGQGLWSDFDFVQEP